MKARKAAALILAPLMGLLCWGCGPAEPGDQSSGAPADLPVFERYDLETYVRPFWLGDTVVNETVMFVGREDEAPLLYEDAELISVRSYDLRTEYEEGRDYTFEGGKLRLTEETRIPCWTEEEYYPALPIPDGSFPCTVPGKNNIVFGEGDTFCSRQIAVTYRHASRWEDMVPEPQTEKFSGFLGKLADKEQVSMVFYGDSITTGANSSKVIGVQPSAESWPDMVRRFLEIRYGVRIQSYNTAVGGTTTAWGLQNVETSVNVHSPDLLVLGFGMNDIGLSPELYRSQIAGIISAVRAKNPECEILLVSTMLPNEEVSGFYGNQVRFEDELLALAEEDGQTGVACVTTQHRQLLRHKRYYDMTGNNVNHPNDFLARLYAQTILTTLLGSY